MEYTTLSNGVQMPLEGFGVFQIHDLDECERVVLDAIDTGYRMIDHRRQLWQRDRRGQGHSQDRRQPRRPLHRHQALGDRRQLRGRQAAIRRSMDNLGVDYIDLYLIHQAMGDYIGAWRAITEAYKEGKIRAIGVCNFYPHRLADFCETVDQLPMVNQVELHPFFQQENALSLMREYGVQPEAWAPFAEGRNGIFTHPVLTKSAKSTARAPARWPCAGTPSAVWRSSPSPCTRSAWSRTSTSGTSASRMRRWPR